MSRLTGIGCNCRLILFDLKFISDSASDYIICNSVILCGPYFNVHQTLPDVAPSLPGDDAVIDDDDDIHDHLDHHDHDLHDLKEVVAEQTECRLTGCHRHISHTAPVLPPPAVGG